MKLLTEAAIIIALLVGLYAVIALIVFGLAAAAGVL